MSRRSAIVTVEKQAAAAAAGTANLYYSVPVPIRFLGFSWGYQAAEAGTDNTLDFVITADTGGDGGFATTLHTNANACGLLDSAAVGEMLTNFGDAAIAGGAAVAVDVTETRVAAGATIRVALTTAGTGTIPAINFAIHYIPLQPLD